MHRYHLSKIGNLERKVIQITSHVHEESPSIYKKLEVHRLSSGYLLLFSFQPSASGDWSLFQILPQ
jgi:hypothetical protein